MSKFFDVLDKDEAMDRLCKSIMPDDTADILEKGKKADIGEIRDWGGHKYQKTAAGWIMIGKSGQTKSENKDINSKVAEHDKKVRSLKEDLHYYYGALDNLEGRKKDYISQYGEEKYNERYKRIEDHIESIKKELDELKDQSKKISVNSPSKGYKKGDYVTAKNSDGVTIKGRVFEVDNDGKYMKIRTTSGDLEYIETKKVKPATGDEQDRIYSTFAKKKFADGRSYNDYFGD